jgi:hypothetical protein
MARATHRQQEKRYDLEKAEGGYVTLRRLNHGEKLDRLDESMHFESGEGDNAKVFVSTARTRLFDFAHCIIDHNLEDDEGKKLDFKNPVDVRRLDGAIGDEIAEKINNHNETIGDDPKDNELPN